ncbi:DUF2974 domain-containing protein [Pediococcus pentosaceus]|jgi:pimeloyl-ACP methyl ester carboxylesterase|uniref:Mbeg1-like protein n=1 Tax=Pediococcus pentosaceus TaxID=1255 RepID=UPI0003C33AEA|nr:Mbeg1-like protein [Pediococcus pentosaceus]AHA04482.1 hypothetical protein T256_01265 [Pediococcus pentosaceus SL4]KAF0465408.1 DUF2974 domain-containing protein [Pediococcus pentosaceus]KAF0521760.1 DUF2974 domain-containing protein [Pediococcus pentosaceus]MBF7103196.1 DUF2974 domain-containing protein [Pediococcus pentosaceus]MBF7129837.1 DUF2974 domain-containing protein [Pediococcus pentosaceus]
MTKLINFLAEYQREIESQPIELDLALFSRLVGLPFEAVLTQPSAPLVEACMKLIEFVDNENYLILPADRQMLEQIAFSNRYQSVQICDVVQGPHRFLAATFVLSKTTKVIAFRGPNGTLLSWKADLHFSFSSINKLKSQAHQYLLQALQHDNQNIYCVGFSQGASIAALACMDISDTHRHRIQTIIFDSPGLPDDHYQSPIPIIELVPPLSLFALVGEHPFHQITISSSSTGIWQHDLYSWEADSHGAFAKNIGITNPTTIQHQFIQLLPSNITDENIDRTLNVAISIFSQLNFHSTSELIKHWNQFNALIQTEITVENIVVKTAILRLQKLIFKNAALNLQSIPLN